jgi:hypothetical protein
MTEQQKKQMLEDDKITFEWFFDEDEFIVPVKLTLWQRIKNRLISFFEWI